MGTPTKNDWPDKTNPDDFLTIPEAARESRMSESSLYEACQRKILAHDKVSGSKRRGKVLIKRCDLPVWLQSQRVEAEGGGKPTATTPPPRLSHLSLD